MDARISQVNRSREAARASYNRLSRWYDFIAGSAEKKFRDRGLKELNAQPGERILEIGFGTGHCLIALAKAVSPMGRVIGIDISDGMLKVACNRLQQKRLDERVRLYRGDGLTLDFIDTGSLHGIFMSFTLELFDSPEIPRVLQECCRILKPGGRLAVVSLTKTDPPGRAVRIYEWFHKHMPAYADCRPIFARQALEQSGFVIQHDGISSMWGLPIEIVLGKKQ